MPLRPLFVFRMLKKTAKRTTYKKKIEQETTTMKEDRMLCPGAVVG
jgi:hypothetical protein